LRSDSLKLLHDLRSAGRTVDYSFTPAKPDKQFKRAQELKAAYTVKLERGESGQIQVKIKNLKTREELVAVPADAAALLR
jgi:histidyl-tRNA synthetase